MPVNEFEKQVQQKMNELQLRPSDEVWEEVEKRIRKEKKRRWLIVWFFLFGAVLLGGTAWWITGSDKKQAPVNNSVAQTVADKKVNEITTGTNDDTKIETIPGKNIDSNYEIKTETIELPSTKDFPMTKTGVAPDTKLPRPVEIDNSHKVQGDINNSAPDILKKKKISKTRPASPVIAKNDQPMVTEKMDSVENNSLTGGIAKADIKTIINDSAIADKNIVQDDPVTNKQEPVFALKDSLVIKQAEVAHKKNEAKAKKNKWEFGIHVMAGISGRSDRISIFDGQKSYDATNLSTPNPATGPVAPQTTTVKEPVNGFSWQVGAYTKRKLALRTGVSVGLDFSSYSTVQQTGAFVDSSRVFSSSFNPSSVRNYYRNGTVVDNKNHYYFLQIPFSFHWQINKGVKLPLVWQNGFSAGFLTGGDALVYNSGSNVFYHDNKLLYKAQFVYQSGLYVKLFNQSRKPFTAGVLFNYHLNKLEKVNSNGNNHLASFGFQLGWLLKK